MGANKTNSGQPDIRVIDGAPKDVLQSIATT